MTFYPTLPAVDAARSGWLFYIGMDARPYPPLHDAQTVRSLFTALADGGFNYLLFLHSPHLAAGATLAAFF